MGRRSGGAAELMHWLSAQPSPPVPPGSHLLGAWGREGRATKIWARRRGLVHMLVGCGHA
eukprot:2320758-Prymnesium_polylepis.1